MIIIIINIYLTKSLSNCGSLREAAGVRKSAMEDRTTILLMDEDEEVRACLATQLRHYDLVVMEARTLIDAKKRLKERRFALVLLAFPPGGARTLALVRRINSKWDIPVMLLAASPDPVQLVAGFGSGAEDYLVKPCNPCELVLRVHALLRRTQRAVRIQPNLPLARYHFGECTFDAEQRRLVGAQGVPIPISVAEVRLLRVLLAHPNTVLSREKLLALTAGDEALAFERSIDSQISRLRKKIERDPRQPRLLKTIWGLGYVLAADVVLA